MSGIIRPGGLGLECSAWRSRPGVLGLEVKYIVKSYS